MCDVRLFWKDVPLWCWAWSAGPVCNTLDYNDHINLPYKDPLWEIFPGLSLTKFVVPWASLCPAARFRVPCWEREKRLPGWILRIIMWWLESPKTATSNTRPTHYHQLRSSKICVEMRYLLSVETVGDWTSEICFPGLCWTITVIWGLFCLTMNIFLPSC